MHRTLNDGRPRARPGFSLAEIMVSLVLLGIIAGGIMTIISRQQQFYRSATEVIDTRQQIRSAAAIIPVDLRGASSIGGDILSMTEKGMTVRANIGSSITCTRGPNQILIPPQQIARGSVFTSFLANPRVGDVALIFDDGLPGNQDDDWKEYVITAVDSTLVGCATFTDATADAAQYRYLLTFGTNLSLTIVDGAPVRFAKRVQYNFYQSSADLFWWLGYRECLGNGTGCSVMQPVSGPYRPFIAGDTLNSGMNFVYRDSTGAVTYDRTKVARVELFVHGQTQGAVSMGGGKSAPYMDYMKVTIAIRNRS